MKNADMPAMPQEWEAYVEGTAPSGLTKREYFAGLAMQAILSRHELGTDYELQDVPESSVLFADALLAELEKPNDL